VLIDTLGVRGIFFDFYWSTEPKRLRTTILEAAGVVLKIGSSLKPNHHWEIELAQICEALCSIPSVLPELKITSMLDRVSFKLHILKTKPIFFF